MAQVQRLRKKPKSRGERWVTQWATSWAQLRANHGAEVGGGSYHGVQATGLEAALPAGESAGGSKQEVGDGGPGVAWIQQ